MGSGVKRQGAFNPYALPAKEKFAEIHRRATKFGVPQKMTPEEFQKSLCPCCLLPSNTKSLKFSTATLENIGKASLRAKEYFQLILFFFATISVSFVLNSVPQFFFNPSISKCFLSNCYNHVDKLEEFYSQLSRKNAFKYWGVQLLMLASVLVIFVMKYLFFYFLVRQNKRESQSTNAVKHFSVHAHNLRGSSEEEIKREIVESFRNRKFKTGAEVSLSLETRSIVEVSKLKNVRNLYRLLVKFINVIKSTKIEVLRDQRTQNKKSESRLKLQKLKRKILEIRSSESLKEAFVTFDSNRIPGVLVSGKWSTFVKKYITRSLFFTRALEPSDVIWENFGDSDVVQLLKIVMSYTVALLVVGGGRVTGSELRADLLHQAVASQLRQGPRGAGRADLDGSALSLQLQHRGDHHIHQFRAAEGDRVPDAARKAQILHGVPLQ